MFTTNNIIKEYSLLNKMRWNSLHYIDKVKQERSQDSGKDFDYEMLGPGQGHQLRGAYNIYLFTWNQNHEEHHQSLILRA